MFIYFSRNVSYAISHVIFLWRHPFDLNSRTLNSTARSKHMQNSVHTHPGITRVLSHSKEKCPIYRTLCHIPFHVLGKYCCISVAPPFLPLAYSNWSGYILFWEIAIFHFSDKFCWLKQCSTLMKCIGCRNVLLREHCLTSVKMHPWFTVKEEQFLQKRFTLANSSVKRFYSGKFER